MYGYARSSWRVQSLWQDDETVRRVSCMLYDIVETFMIWLLRPACPGGAVGSVAVRDAWLLWPTSLGSRPRLDGSFVSGYSGVCFEIKFSGRHRGFDGVLIKLWPFANIGYRGAQSLVPAWITDNRWRTTAWSGRPLMALFARVAKLGSGTYGARHARIRLSVMQCV